VVGILPGDALRFALTRRQHDVNPIGAIRRGSGKQQASRLVLLIQPLPMLFIMLLLAFLFLGQRA
jgi:hypothetical protein